jgi:diamine N-acetyltransferase
MENQSSTDKGIHISALTRFTWEKAASLELEDYQQDFMPSVLYSLAQSKFENLFPYGIFEGDKLVGFLMYGEFSGRCWINRIMVDKRFQQQGVGSTALRHLIDLLRGHPKCQEIRTSFSRKNALAEYFFRSAGFEVLNDGLPDEIVMVYRR